MRVRSLFTLVTALTLTVGPVQVTNVQAATGFMQLISAQQLKAQVMDEECAIDDDCRPPPPPPPPKKKKVKKIIGGGIFNASGKDMVYCLPPTC